LDYSYMPLLNGLYSWYFSHFTIVSSKFFLSSLFFLNTKFPPNICTIAKKSLFLFYLCMSVWFMNMWEQQFACVPSSIFDKRLEFSHKVFEFFDKEVMLDVKHSQLWNLVHTMTVTYLPCLLCQGFQAFFL